MGALHVVALVERVDGHLPVGREHGREVGADAEAIEVVRGEQLGSGSRNSSSGGAPGSRQIQTKPPQQLDLDGLEAGARRDRVELVLVHDLDQRAVEVVAPGVIATADAGVGEGAGSVGQSGAAVQARVVKGLDGVGVGADDEDGLIADQVFEE